MAKDGEVALLLQSYNEDEMLIVWGRQLDQVADAVVKAHHHDRHRPGT